MLNIKKEHPKEKIKLHERNKHRSRYDFKQLIACCPELAQFVKVNIYGDESIDFFNPEAVKMLNKSLLKFYYDIEFWDIPQGYLCPPIPGRADYIHHIADLLANRYNGKIPKGKKIQCLDIGVGANCVYPIIGVKEFDWNFTGTDIDVISIESAQKIIEQNSILRGKVELRLQKNPKDILRGIINKDDFFDLTICNPPFHSSYDKAKAGTIRKLNNLKQKNISKPILNFGGRNNELWCDGGEIQFVSTLIKQSKEFEKSCFWFSTLISKESNLKSVYSKLNEVKVADYKTITMGQGNKTSRIVAWTFNNSNPKVG